MSAELIKLPRNAYPEPFEKLWTYSLRKNDAKKAAFKAYQKALKRDTHENILGGTRAWWVQQRNDPEFAPMLSTFLNQERWRDYDPRPQLEVVEVDITVKMWDGIGPDLADKWTLASEWLASGEYGPFYRAWLSKLTLTGRKDGRLIFKAPSAFMAGHIRNNYADILARAVGAPVEIYS